VPFPPYGPDELFSALSRDWKSAKDLKDVAQTFFLLDGLQMTYRTVITPAESNLNKR
jgi:hypothetical protein